MTTLEPPVIDIESILKWSPPKRVETKNGPRILRTASPTETFLAAYQSHRDKMYSAGLSVGKHWKTGVPEVCWWQPLSAQAVQVEQETIAASKAADADVVIPVPDGLAYLGYQKAGIAFALKTLTKKGENAPSRGCLIADEMGL